MRADSLQPNEYTYAGCIDACAKAMQWKKARQLLSEMRTAGVEVRYPHFYRDCCCALLVLLSATPIFYLLFVRAARDRTSNNKLCVQATNP